MKLLVLEFSVTQYVFSCSWKWSKFFSNLENTLKESHFPMVFLWGLLFVWVDFCLFRFSENTNFFQTGYKKGLKGEEFFQFELTYLEKTGKVSGTQTSLKS